jgi:hypothetical protein
MSEHIESPKPRRLTQLVKDARKLRADLDGIEPKAAAAAEWCRSAAVRRIQAEVDALTQRVDATAASAAKTAAAAARSRSTRKKRRKATPSVALSATDPRQPAAAPQAAKSPPKVFRIGAGL